jgi:hypothetical protein
VSWLDHCFVSARCSGQTWVRWRSCIRYCCVGTIARASSDRAGAGLELSRLSRKGTRDRGPEVALAWLHLGDCSHVGAAVARCFWPETGSGACPLDGPGHGSEHAPICAHLVLGPGEISSRIIGSAGCLY